MLGWWLRSLRPDREPGITHLPSSESWTPESLEDRSLGFIRVQEDGSIRLSRGVAGVLAGLGSSEEPPDPSQGIDAWAAAVVPEDRSELAGAAGNTSFGASRGNRFTRGANWEIGRAHV